MSALIIDTSNCEAEPIRFPGTVQPHGALLVLEPASGIIEAASESCTTLLGISAASLLGQPASLPLGARAARALLEAPPDGLNPLVSLLLNGRQFSARASRNAAGQLLVDIETGGANDTNDGDDAAFRLMTYQRRRVIETLRRLTDIAAITSAAAEQFRALTGFDQVMIYRFDAAWNGEVIAEARADAVEPYLGLNFPASDIPRQARELFRLCRVRVIPDALYTPAALLARGDGKAIDLGLSALRSVSPIHLEYLKNMGARATLVGALVVDERLWGLLSCQQKREPKYFGPAARDALGWLCEDLANLIQETGIRQRREREHDLARRRRALIDSIRALEFKALMRPENNANLLGVVGADGFALIVDAAIQITGRVPSIERIRQLQERRLERGPDATLFASSALSSELGLDEVGDGVAGALFVSVVRQPKVTMIWFRSERSHSLRWGGDPQHPHSLDASGRLSPRNSFAQFLQEIRGQSAPWSAEELESAAELRSLVEIEALREKETLSQTILDSMAEQISVLDAQGVIVTVNEAWKRFALANDAPQLAAASLGNSYRDICAAAADPPYSEQAAAAWAGIEAVLSGRLASFSLDYLCDSPAERRWFRMSVFPMRAPGAGAVVAHENITPRKLAELALIASEKRYRSLLEDQTELICRFQADGAVIYVNDAFCRFFGKTRDALVGQKWQPAVLDDDLPRVKAQLNSLSPANPVVTIENRVLARDGALRWAQFVNRAFFDERGELTEVQAVARDITEQKQAAARIEQLMREQQAILDSRVVGIVKLRERRIVWANAAFAEMFGYPVAELIGQLTRSIYPSEEAYQQFGAASQATLARGEVFEAEIQYRRKDGTLGWYAISCGMLDADSQEVMGVFTDISRRKEAEAALAHSDERLRSIFHSMAEGLVLQRRDGSIIDANPAAETLLGFSRDQLLGMRSADPGWQAVREDGSPFPGADHPAMLTLRSGAPLRNQVMGIRAPGRELRWISINSQAIFAADQTVPEAVVCTFADVTERKRLEDDLIRSAREIEDLYNQAPCGYHSIGPDGILLQINATELEWLGVRREEVIGKMRPSDFFTPAGQELFAQMFPKLKKDGHLENIEFELIGRNVAPRQVSVSATTINDADGKFLMSRSVMFDISENKGLEARLQKLLAQQQALLDNELVGIVTSRNRVIVWANPAFEKMLGYQRGEMAGLPTRVSYPSDAAYEAFGAAAYAALARGRVFRSQVEYVRKDGGRIWVEVSGTLLDALQGTSLWCFVDISERKLADARLARLLADQEAILNSEAVGFSIMRGRVIDWLNDAAARMLGYEREELLQRSARSFYPDDQAFDEFGRTAYAEIAAGRVFHGQLQWLHQDGSLRWFDISGARLPSDGEASFWAFVDVSVQRDAEEKVRQAELLLRSAIETIGEAFVIFDPEDRLVFCNDEYRELYRSSAPVIETGRSFAEIIAYGAEHGQYRDAVGREAAWVAERLAARCQGDQELIQQLDDGRWVKVRERRTGSGFMVGFRVDVSDLYRAKEAAETANIAKSRFLATMSHEIRTPLNGILGMAQMLLMPKLEDAERVDYARTVLNSGQTLLTLLNDILDFSKVEAGRLELESVALDPAQIMQETRMLFSETARQKGLRLESAWTGPLAQRYLGDPYRLRQMISNLVGNAIKFTPQGEIRIGAHEVERDESRALLEFAVADTGIGMAAAERQHLFRPFSQADSSTTRHYGGTGLGLSIVRSLATQMGGEVGVDSEAGRGSRFWFRIRLSLVAAGEDQPVLEAREPCSAPAARRQLAGRVLVVEDTLTNRLVIDAMLRSFGLSVALVEDGRQAVAAVAAGDSADLILMDLQMPVMDGYQASRCIRQWEAEHARPRRPIIALTADAQDENRQHCLAAGMDEILTKPIAIAALAAALGRYLRPAAGTGEAAPAAAPPTRQADAGRIAELVAELDALLADGKFDAIGHFRTVQKALAGTEFADELAGVARLIAKLSFEPALHDLRRIAAARGWRAMR